MSDDERWLVTYLIDGYTNLQDPIWFKTYKEALAWYNEEKPDKSRDEVTYLLHISRKKPHEQRFRKCPTCFGTGKELIVFNDFYTQRNPVPSEFSTCSRCRGTGKIPDIHKKVKK
jgi:hypothetical protein